MLIMLIINIISAKTLQCTVTVTDMYSRKTLCKKNSNIDSTRRACRSESRRRSRVEYRTIHR